MIVKILSKELIRHIDCVSAVIRPDIQDLSDPPDDARKSIIFECSNGGDMALPLSDGDMIFYMNDNGKTIDRDFSMCGKSIQSPPLKCDMCISE